MAKFVDVCCPSCGVLVKFSEMHLHSLRASGRPTYCPSGHLFCFVPQPDPSGVDALKKTIEEQATILLAVRRENAELKTRLVELRHRLEFREAGAENGGGNVAD